MPSVKVAITIDQSLLGQVDRWVAEGDYPNRSQAIQSAVRQLEAQRSRRHRLLNELAKLDPEEERKLADEVLVADLEWPEY